ncbi:MAG TPA: TIGR03960 family B12-binding radical SAM protein [Planctomycetota bacterium]|nr:TIGR03960 family B12-binding radical SAM protein [Planctomycetota bacterium]
MVDDIRTVLNERVLPFVETPAQYVGGEPNSVVKDHADVDVTFALAFPDAYTVGISHLGMQILYAILNTREDVAAERCYAPFPDMVAKLREERVPLYSLETRTPLRQFDIVGFSLQYEMCATNVLLMLDLAGIPLLSERRTAEDPLVIAGGPCAFNPEPMSGFIDLFIIGDGEEAVLALIDEFKAARGRKKNTSRRDLLTHLAKKVPGAYAPSLYNVEYNEDNTIKSVEPAVKGVPERVTAALLKDMDSFPPPTKLIVPLVEAVHDRISLEVVRGCTHGCRFCQAGMIKRPYRARDAMKLIDAACASYRATGYSEVSLGALSISDYPHLYPLLKGLTSYFDPLRVNISLPSLRVNKELKELPSVLSRVRKSGLTLAPEAATESLRMRINKNITDEDLLSGVREAYLAGWETVKLYFMVGLPGETDADVDAIAKLARKVSLLRKELGKAPARVNISVAPFVPKPHTPFQWDAMLTADALRMRQGKLKSDIKGQNIWLKAHRVDRSVLEGIFARGDRTLGMAIFEAYRRGCMFDAWEEHFSFEKWEKVLADCRIDPAFYAHRERPEYEVLPWDHIDAGVTKKFLISERHRAANGEVTPNCLDGKCNACGQQENCLTARTGNQG